MGGLGAAGGRLAGTIDSADAAMIFCIVPAA